MGAGHLPRRCRCFDYVPDSFPYAMPRRICESDECFPSGNGCQYRFPWSDYHYRGDSQWLLCSGGSFMGGIWTMKGEYYFSPSQVAFYPASLREVYEYAGCWPVDGEWVSAELHEQLMNEQAAGRAISSDVKGNPVAIERPPLSRQQRSAHERRWRKETTLLPVQYHELMSYRASLRDWPEEPLFPDSGGRPSVPDWLRRYVTP